MASKVTKLAFGGNHTAGIYSDMTVDGPEIGTLVVIVDRAKNLPNRKSMGKQDPYCAARLGKEAKKTETDKRGGQTPRWDQELRFTVRESPDYYQLKVSVFNDDKRTELIGETWISLDAIIVPGGGKNDLWHNLNCKGKYAGELRIELTYYDTRPRETRIEETMQSAAVDGVSGSAPGREGMAGPRQMKTKRKPLPTDSSGFSASLQTQPQSLPSLPQSYAEGPDDYALNGPPPFPSQLQHPQPTSSRGLPFNSLYNVNQTPYDESPAPEQFLQHGSRVNSYGLQNNLVSSQSPQDGHYEQSSPYDPSYDIPQTTLSGRYTSGNPRLMTGDVRDNIDPRLLNQQQRLNMVHSNSAPSMIDRSALPISPISKQNSYDSSPVQRSPLRESSGDAWPSLDHGIMQDNGPPPPPQHRHGGSRSGLQSQSRDSYGSMSPTASFNIAHDHGEGFTHSPLSQMQGSSSSTISAMSTSPSRQQYPHHSSVSSMSSYNNPRQRRSQSPIRESRGDREVYGDSMPPSLTPGYDPSIAAEESERLIREQRMIGQQTAQGPMPKYQQAATVPIQYPRAQPIPRGFESINNRREHREHRYSAPVLPTSPIGRPQPVSTDPRIPMRKSVSPQPISEATERRHSELPSQTPFGPDSFDVYNPAIGSADSINETGARYNTPEQAREAKFQHDKQSKLGDGPIIGSNGRIIDPSDHLPSDTWAPEPEPKAPKRGPEVTIRFKHSPQGAQPMPPSQNTRQPLREARPNVVSSSPIYPQQQGGGGDPSPAASASRTRLQKKSRAGVVAQSNSSPLMPTTLNTMPRMAASDYHPLRESGGNLGIYGNGSNSPSSYGNLQPPPVPGKVPINASSSGGQEDWGGASALSEEMRRIDIGVGGGGRGPPRRARVGFRDV